MLTVPVGDVLVGNAGSNVEHDDTALAVDVVAIAQTAKLFLASSVPDVELDGAKVLSICVSARSTTIVIGRGKSVRW